MAGRMEPVMAEDDWATVKAALVAVFAEEGRRLQKYDESIVFDANGRLMRYGDIVSWLTVSRFGAMDPLIETTATVAGEPGSYRMSADIGTFDGEVFAEIEGDEALTVDDMVNRLRRFLVDNADLLERMAASAEPT